MKPIFIKTAAARVLVDHDRNRITPMATLTGIRQQAMVSHQQ